MKPGIRNAVIFSGGVGLSVATLFWTIAASWIFVWLAGLSDVFPDPRFEWWIYATHTPSRNTKLYLTLSAIAASAPFIVVIAVALKSFLSRVKLRRTITGQLKPQERGPTDNHGTADWLTIKEAQKLFSGPHPLYGGIVVGEAYRVDRDRKATERFDPSNSKTWGMGGTVPLLIDPCTDGPTHSMIFSGPGGFKSTTAVSTLLHWTGSSVVLDPSCELGPMMEKALVDQGKHVHQIRMTNAKDIARSGINVLDWIDIKHPEAEQHVRTAVSWIYDEDTAKKSSGSDDPFFMPMGRELVTALLAHMLWDDTPGLDKSLRTLREGLSVPEGMMPGVLKSIHTTSKSQMARMIAGNFMDMRAPETFSGVYANAIKGTSWLSIAAYADLTSGKSFNCRELLHGDTTVFLQIPLQTLMTTPALARVLVGALMNTVYMADGNLSGRVLFLLDEAARLGRMKTLETARDTGRKYGITMQLLYQSVGQLIEQWGRDGKRAWFDAVSWVGYAAIQDQETAREVSAACGTHSVLAYSEGDNRGRQLAGLSKGSSRSQGNNVNVHEISRPLIRTDELTQEMRTDEMIILARGSRPLRCGRAIYFRRAEMTALLNQNRFAKT